MILLIQFVSYDVQDVLMDHARNNEWLNVDKKKTIALTSPISVSDLGSVIKIRSSSLIGWDIQLTIESSVDDVDITVDVVLWFGCVNDQHGSS